MTWEAPADFVVDYTARLTGPMALPEYDPETRAAYEAATGEPLRSTSPTDTVHDLQLTRAVRFANGSLGQFYVAVRNVFDYRQPSPLVGYYDGNPASATCSTRPMSTARSRGATSAPACA